MPLYKGQTHKRISTCLRKVRYRSKVRADNALKELIERNRYAPHNDLAVYSCAYCAGYHIGHKLKKGFTQ